MQGTASQSRRWEIPAAREIAEFNQGRDVVSKHEGVGRVLAVIFDHRHRGNLHIKAWLLAGPWAMPQEAVVPERQACIGTYHEPYQEACQGATRGRSGEPHCWAAPACEASQGVGVCGSNTRGPQFNSEA